MADLSRMRVLVVDDVETNVDVLVDALGDDYRVSVAMDGETALEAVDDHPPDLILLDIMMPGIDGYEVMQRLRAGEKTRHIPVVFLTALTEAKDEARGLALGAVDYITKPFNAELVRARVKNHLELKQHKDDLESLVEQRTQELLMTQDVSLESIGTLAEFRDPQTGGHIKRTQNYVRCLADYLKGRPRFSPLLDQAHIDRIFKSAPLHDIGKVAIPDTILKKPGKLTPGEFKIMKTHTIYGYDALTASTYRLGQDSFLNCAGTMALTHHERWDGSGYPHGLEGEAIPIEGRLMAIADVYDALVSKRVYKPPLPHSKAVGIILEGKGRHFDPDMVDAFESLAENFRAIAMTYADYDEERITLGR